MHSATPRASGYPKKIKKIEIAAVIPVVTEVFNITVVVLFDVPRGRGQDHPARSAALYINRKRTAKPLNEVVGAFGLAHYGIASGMIGCFAKRIQQDKLLEGKVKLIEKTIKV